MIGVELENADFSSANLENADLTDSNLNTAKLAGSDLLNTNLSNANLQGADLRGVSLGSVSDLTGANLQYVNLERTDLRSASLASISDLTGANLSNAMIDNSILLEPELYQTKIKVIKSTCNWEQAIYQIYKYNKKGEIIGEVDDSVIQQYVEQLKQDTASDPENPVDCSKWQDAK